MNHWELQKYQLRANSHGQAIRAVKQILHLNPGNSYRMDSTDVFDTKLQSAVIEFQRTARLRNVNGTIDLDQSRRLKTLLMRLNLSLLSWFGY